LAGLVFGGPSLSESGYLCVERQWVAENLTDVELLEALGHAFIVLTKLVNDITQQKGPAIVYSKTSDKRSIPQDVITQEDPDDIPHCMRSFAEYRIVCLKLPTKEVVRFVEFEQESEKDFKETIAHYKLSEFKNNKKTTTSLRTLVEDSLELGKRILGVDGYHNLTIISIDNKRRVYISQTAFDDQDDKYMFWNQFAKKVKHDKITEIIVIGETWISSFDPKQPWLKPSDVPDKKEALQAVGISCKGDEITIIAPFTNMEGKIEFEENIEPDKVGVSFLEPIKRAWGIG